MSKKTKAGSVVRRFGNGGENIATRGLVYAEKKYFLIDFSTGHMYKMQPQFFERYHICRISK